MDKYPRTANFVFGVLIMAAYVLMIQAKFNIMAAILFVVMIVFGGISVYLDETER